MKKKWWIIAAATIAACIGLAFVIPALRPWRPGVTKENFDRIEIGMTRTEVEAILGSPGRAEGKRMIWSDEQTHAGVLIRIDEEQRVQRKTWYGDDDRSVLTKLLDHLPWRNKEPDPEEFAVF